MKYKNAVKATAARVRQLKFKTVSLSAHERMTDICEDSTRVARN